MVFLIFPDFQSFVVLFNCFQFVLVFLAFRFSSSLIAHSWQTCVAMSAKRLGMIVAHRFAELDGSASTAQKVTSACRKCEVVKRVEMIR